MSFLDDMLDGETLILEHNPDSGCGECPLMSYGMRGQCTGNHDRHALSTNELRECAPDWCPLRRGLVIVRKPSEEES